MTPEYERDLYMLAFDRRGSFHKPLFGVTGPPTPEERARIANTKALIFEGFLEASICGGIAYGQATAI
jgi:5-dehydro-2-deoxygluconokinase